MNTITVDDLITALEKNGLKQTFGSMFRNKHRQILYAYQTDEDKVVYACAIGQMAINTHIWPDDIATYFHRYFNFDIIYYNDGQKLTFSEIAAKLREQIGERKNETIEVHSHPFYPEWNCISVLYRD